ncbi:MAG: ATP-binding protein [Bacteroidales bacterium]|nr:ATP-binding protein [Bacteroidales bacterium]
MINRKIYSKLEHFYKNHKNALLVTGARQVGKTFSIRHFGKSHFASFVEFNFIENPELIQLFAGAKGVDDLLLRLSTSTSIPLIEGETLVFFDEVQECPALMTAIKFLVDDGRFRYILSGSLLGVDLKDWRSVPVGYMGVCEMFPLDLQEFFEAIGVQPIVFDAVRKCWDEKTPVDAFVHAKLMEAVRLYLLVGGMPAVVDAYLQTNNMQRVAQQQQDILSLYRLDIAKYDVARKLYLEEIFRLIPSELNAKNKRFILKDLNENLKFQRYENSFLWLKGAGVAIPVYNVDEPKQPLLLARSRNLFKLFQNDVGLLTAQYAGDIQRRVLQGDTSINYGAIYENLVAQELKAHGFDMYYFNSKRQGEVDFVVEDGGVLPIEVKSGKDYALHRALANIMNVEDYALTDALVLCNDNLHRDGKVLYAPIYMIMFVEKKPCEDFVYKFEM